MNPAIKDRLERCKTLPTLPAVALHLLRLCEKEDFEIADVARVISTDPAMSAKVLRLVNSPLFGLKKEVSSVQHALTLLGMKTVRNVALSFSLLRGLRSGERPGFDYTAYWKRSILCAVSAQETARLLKVPRFEEAFLSALVQDLGMLALAQTFPDTYGGLVGRAGGDHDKLLQLEAAELGENHSAVARWLLVRWRFPESLRLLIDQCHAIDAPPPKKGDEQIARVMAFSGVLADIWVAPDTAAITAAVAEKARDWLGFKAPAMGALIGNVSDAIGDIAKLFDVNLGRPEDLLRIRTVALENLNPAAAVVASNDIGQVIPLTIEGFSDKLRERVAEIHDPGVLDPCLDQVCADATSNGKALSFVICDVDNLARVNTAFGNDVGDKTLQKLAQLLRAKLRGRDLAARLEEGRFLLVLIDTGLVGSLQVAERLRKQVEEATFDVGVGNPLRLTASMGCACLSPELNKRADLIAAGLQAARLAKGQGRNRVSVFSQPAKRGVA